MATIEVNYFNTFTLNRLVDSAGDPTFPKWLGGDPVSGPSTDNWYVEESRIRGGYNNVSNGYGVKAYIVENQNNAQELKTGIIFSGIFNSRTGFNETNQFSVGKDITKSLNPVNGSIQRLYAEDTNLTIFQENKVSRALINKDAIYSAEGGGSVTSSTNVIGEVVPYAGEFGISEDPMSFAVYGYRKYFTDRRRNAVLRLSMDGITEISNYGMKDFFRDSFNDMEATGYITGAFDVNTKTYNLSVQKNDVLTNNKSTTTYNTLYFDDAINGWVSFMSFKPRLMGSNRNKFFTFKNGKIYQHHSDEKSSRGTFYGDTTSSHVEFIFNANPSTRKVFNTINYEGSNGWQIDSIVTDATGKDYTDIYNSYTDFVDKGSIIYSYNEGAWNDNGVIRRAGFDRRENKYHADIINSTAGVLIGDGFNTIVNSNSSSGIKGFYSTVRIKTDTTTDPGNVKELFAVSTNVIESSY